MTKSKTMKHDPNALPLTRTPDETVAQVKARAALKPSMTAVVVIDAFKGNLMGEDVDLGEMVKTMGENVRAVKGGDLSHLEAMLLSQAVALETVFASLARRAAHQEQLKHYGVFMGLALKAQSQSRATISALVDLKYPRQATFIKQANVTNGPQQVNNGAGPAPVSASLNAHAEETKSDHPELLEHHHGERLDTGTTSTASGVDPRMATVEAVNRPEDTRGQSQGRTQRRPGRGAG
jgi:hypothetical protein